ncbi:tryptophan halogenase family protein [Asticcacaulis sp. AC402]|uniref:tryptophan halogenase family protein n=1 Tax=Asticcacaulis sp. AC402 TaxID=1282361 RepID=UPI0004CF57C9|nr:tryptophan halogenase family protein [Asticcacaulis sp. AC402]
MSDNPQAIKSICIVGGGTAGWMAASALAHEFKRLPIAITLVESEEIGTVGVGEATLPHIRNFNTALNIDEVTFMKATEATFKLGIEFCNWGRIGDRYIHPFGDYGEKIDGIPFYQHWLRLQKSGLASRLDDYAFPTSIAEANRFRHPSTDATRIESTYGYAYQFDATRYAAFLRQFAEARGVVRRQGKVVDTRLDAETGHVASLTLDSGEVVAADLYVDCSGFRGLLIEQALKTGYEDWSQWLPCNRALAVPCESRGTLTPYTRATALEAGWQWRIPLQHRTGNGYVYCSSFISDEDASRRLLGNLDAPALADPRQLYFTTGRRKKLWNHNVVAIGLAAGFLEPLESTSIHLIQEGISELLHIFPDKRFLQSDIDEYNRRMGVNFERVRDFLLLHYAATQRDDTEMWRHFRNLKLPDSLDEKIQIWLTRGQLIRYEFGVFLPPSWVAVMLGQNLLPRHYDPRVDRMPHDRLVQSAEGLRRRVNAAASATPDHKDYIRQMGAASDTGPLVAQAG